MANIKKPKEPQKVLRGKDLLQQNVFKFIQSATDRQKYPSTFISRLEWIYGIKQGFKNNDLSSTFKAQVYDGLYIDKDNHRCFRTNLLLITSPKYSYAEKFKKGIGRPYVSQIQEEFIKITDTIVKVFEESGLECKEKKIIPVSAENPYGKIYLNGVRIKKNERKNKDEEEKLQSTNM